jgi:hypothetical protein
MTRKTNLEYSTDDSSLAELRPSSTIVRPKRQGLIQSWEKIFQASRKRNTEPKPMSTKQFIQPKMAYHQESNKAVGVNILMHTESLDLKTIWFHNINGMKDEKNWAQIITTMKENKINIFGFTEINKSMDNFWRH